MTARLGALGATTLAAALCLLAPASPAHAAAADGANASSSASQGPLIDPESDDALLNLLMEDGIQYTTSSTVDDAESYGGADSTLVIDGDETGLDAQQIQQLAHGRWGRIIVLSVDQNLLDALAPGVYAEGPGADSGGSAPVDPGCGQTDASSAGSVLMPTGSEVYQVAAAAGATPSATDTGGADATASASGTTAPQITDVTSCYTPGDAGGPAMVSLRNATTGGDVIVLGFTDFVENQYLAQQGDAALALRLFGAHGTLVWLATSFTEDQNLTGCQGASCGNGGNGTAPSGPGGSGGGSGGGGGGQGGNGNGSGGGSSARSVTLAQLIPHWIWWMLLQLVVAAVALAYWRSRRLGRLVSEQLPVKVRAAETVEGHANLYRRAAAHGRAAGLLRSAAARRIAPLLGVPAGPAGRAPATLVDPIAARLGRPAEQVRAILAGAAPMTEAELVQLTDQLDRLEQEVRSP
jgi:hypothetical protein